VRDDIFGAECVVTIDIISDSCRMCLGMLLTRP
jgi:hypothetical protein